MPARKPSKKEVHFRRGGRGPWSFAITSYETEAQAKAACVNWLDDLASNLPLHLAAAGEEARRIAKEGVKGLPLPLEFELTLMPMPTLVRIWRETTYENSERKKGHTAPSNIDFEVIS